MRSAPFVRSPYNYDGDEVSVETGYQSDEPSLTQQEFAEDADINTIVKRFGVTGQLPQGVRMPSYGDFTGIGDFRDALEALERAEAAFMEMPAEVRARFKNDPALFVDFCSDAGNLEEARKLGLVPVADEVKPEAKAPASGSSGEPTK